MMGTFHALAAADPMQHVLPHSLFHLGPFNFTNHMLMLLIASAVMLLVFPRLARNYPLVPTGVRNLFEALMQFIRKEVAYPSLHEHTDRFMPFLWTLFFFILINNLLGMMPLDSLSVLILGKSHLFGTATAGLSVTAGLASFSFALWNIMGYLEHYQRHLRAGMSFGGAATKGLWTYLASFVPHIPGPIGVVLFVPLLGLELALSFVKPFALAIRLFANMMAGHVVLASLLILIPALRNLPDLGIAVPTIVGCAALGCLELFVAFLQAYIFTFLTCMFIGAALNPEH